MLQSLLLFSYKSCDRITWNFVINRLRMTKCSEKYCLPGLQPSVEHGRRGQIKNSRSRCLSSYGLEEQIVRCRTRHPKDWHWSAFVFSALLLEALNSLSEYRMVPALAFRAVLRRHIPLCTLTGRKRQTLGQQFEGMHAYRRIS